MIFYLARTALSICVAALFSVLAILVLLGVSMAIMSILEG